MTTDTSILDRHVSPALIVGSGVAAAVVWVAFRFAPIVLLAALVILGVIALAIGAQKRPEVSIIALVGAAGLDSTGRLAALGGVRITVYQILLLTVLLFAVSRIRAGRARLVATPIDVPLAAFLAVVAVSILMAVRPQLAVVQFLSLLSCGLLVYLICALVDTPERAETVVLGVLLLASIWSVGAYLEKNGFLHFGQVISTFASGIRPKVTFKDPNIFASFLSVSAALALPLLVIAKSWPKRIALLGGVGLCFMAILLSGSRGALVGFLIGVLVMILVLRIPLWQKLLLVAATVLVLFVGIESLMSTRWITDKVLGFAQDRSWIYRTTVLRSAIRMANENVFGVGGGNFPQVYPFYRNPIVRSNLVESHTMLATLLVEYGAFGLLMFVWLLWRYVTRVALVAWREELGLLQALATGVLAAGAAILAQSFVYSLETSKYLWLTIGLGMAVYIMWRDKTREEHL